MKALVFCLIAGACASAQPPVVLDAPAEAARHRAALAMLAVSNGTTSPLEIAFRSATPPLQEVVIGRVAAGGHADLAPVPAGEPIILVARRPDGREFVLAPRLFSLDAEWTWEIPNDASFTNPERPG